VIRAFRNAGTEDIFNGQNSKAARKTCAKSLWKVAARKLDQLDSVALLDELGVPPGNQLETLTGDRKGQHCIRIND
jgi:proteic killer suppression protein